MDQLLAIRGERADDTDFDELRARIKWSVATEAEMPRLIV